jgi:hypothetical protein
VKNALQQLARATEDLFRAAESGDFAAVNTALSERDIALAELQLRGTADLNPGGREEFASQLVEIERQADRAVRALCARRETARVVLSELEVALRVLGQWRPNLRSARALLDVNA